MDISIVLCSFNAESTIRRALQSISHFQSELEGLSLEVIIVEDGSRDQTLGIINEWMLEGGASFTKLFRSMENRGLGASRNLGIEKASGEWLFFMDSDDQLLPNKACLLADAVKTEFSRDCLIFSYWTTVDKPEVMKIFEIMPRREGLSGLLLSGPGLWRILFRTQWLQRTDVRFPEVRVFEDLAFTVDLVLASPLVSNVNGGFYLYYDKVIGSLTNVTDERWREHSSLVFSVARKLRAKVPDSLVLRFMFHHSFFGFKRTASSQKISYLLRVIVNFCRIIR